MSSELLRLEELGLKLEELKKEIENDRAENNVLDDKKQNVNLQITNINYELEELYAKKNLKENSVEIKTKNFFKLARISMAMTFVISLIVDCIEGITINETFPSYFNFAVFFCSMGAMVPFHAVHSIKINKQCKAINLDEINILIDTKSLQLRDLKKELVEIKNDITDILRILGKKQDEMSFVRSEIKTLESQININSKQESQNNQFVKTK